MQTCDCNERHDLRRIVLTGGPGAGKTAVLELIRQSFCAHVKVLPESAGIIFGGGFPRSDGAELRQATQRAIFYVQRELEIVADVLAAEPVGRAIEPSQEALECQAISLHGPRLVEAQAQLADDTSEPFLGGDLFEIEVDDERLARDYVVDLVTRGVAAAGGAIGLTVRVGVDVEDLAHEAGGA